MKDFTLRFRKKRFFNSSRILFITLFLLFCFYLQGCSKKPQDPLPAPPQPLPRDDTHFNHIKFLKWMEGREMALVPEGPFPRGSKRLGGPDERPVYPVMLAGFYIDLYEVTNQEYQRFVTEKGYKPPNVMVFYEDLSLLSEPKQPVVGIEWRDAEAYCRWAGKRLPTEAEWEKAAHGIISMDWPWGMNFMEWYANVDGDEDGYRYTAPVGSYEQGRSPYGLYDMSGNVSEWVSDWYGSTYYRDGFLTRPTGPDTGDLRVHRGGSWNDRPSDSRASRRFAVFPYRRDATVGFRCAMDAEES